MTLNVKQRKNQVSLLVYVKCRRRDLGSNVNFLTIAFSLSFATSCVWHLCFSSPWLVGSSLPPSSIARRCVGWPFATPRLCLDFVGSKKVALCPCDNFGLLSATWCCSSAFVYLWERIGDKEEWLDLLFARTAWTRQSKSTVSHTRFLLKSS